jgi:hypothetical protein
METLQVTLLNPKAKNLLTEMASLELIEITKPETSLEWYRKWVKQANKRQRQNHLPDEPMTMDEIVALVKEVRAERYAKQNLNNC